MNQRLLVVLLAVAGLVVGGACLLVTRPSSEPTLAPNPGGEAVMAAPTSVAAGPTVTATSTTRRPKAASTVATSTEQTAAPGTATAGAVGIPQGLTLLSNTAQTFTVGWSAAAGDVAAYHVTVNGSAVGQTREQHAQLAWPTSPGDVLVQVAARSADGALGPAAALIVVPPQPPATPTLSATPTRCATTPDPSTVTPMPADASLPATSATPTASPTPVGSPTPTASPTASPTPSSTSASPTATPSSSASPWSTPTPASPSPTPTAVASEPACA